MAPHIRPIRSPSLKRNSTVSSASSTTTNGPHPSKMTPETMAHLKNIKRFYNHWKNNFDWRAHEKKINELPQFETTGNVDGFGDVDLHFLHIKSDNPNTIPLCSVPGWPGSFLEATISEVYAIDLPPTYPPVA